MPLASAPTTAVLQRNWPTLHDATPRHAEDLAYWVASPRATFDRHPPELQHKSPSFFDVKAEATLAAELDGRPPPPDVMLQCGCNASGTPQIRLAQAEYECALLQAGRQAGAGRRRQDLEALVNVRDSTDSGTDICCTRLADRWLPETFT